MREGGAGRVAGVPASRHRMRSPHTGSPTRPDKPRITADTRAS
ncbi:hypothetical protein L810_7557 [Burkholderia sp. AU4i]|nr:hypothetical protein L810_7557 [Burkholderia sp. AU4i]